MFPTLPPPQLVPSTSFSVYGGGGYGYAPVYGSAPGMWVRPAAYAPHHGGNVPCPPCPVQEPARMPDGESSAPEGVDDELVPPPDGEELPEVADLSSEASFASASQSAVPNMIGDTIGFGGTGILTITDFIDFDQLSISPGAGRKYKAATNNSPVPQTRVYYNFHYFDSALTAIANDQIDSIDVKRHEVGFEYAVWCDLASIQVTVPISWSIDSTIVSPMGVIPTPQDTELGNVSVALKNVLYQSCYTTFSTGVAFDLPTADDIFVDNGLQTFELENKTITMSPFFGLLFEPTCNTFVQTFVQTAMPLGQNDIAIGDDFTDDIEEIKLLYVDTSVGVWLYNNGCGTGVAALGELHLSTTIGEEERVFFDDAGVVTEFFEDNWKALHATGGLAFTHNGWSVTPAIVLPLLDAPDRFFDWEATIHVNRRF